MTRQIKIVDEPLINFHFMDYKAEPPNLLLNTFFLRSISLLKNVFDFNQRSLSFIHLEQNSWTFPRNYLETVRKIIHAIPRTLIIWKILN